MTLFWTIATVAACLAVTYGCFRLGVWLILWRFRQ
jgi:hypothetical protein